MAGEAAAFVPVCLAAKRTADALAATVAAGGRAGTVCFFVVEEVSALAAGAASAGVRAVPEIAAVGVVVRLRRVCCGLGREKAVEAAWLCV